MNTATLNQLDAQYFDALPKGESTVDVGNIGAYMEWSDEIGCDFHIVIQKNRQASYWVECLNGKYRAATIEEVAQWYEHN